MLILAIHIKENVTSKDATSTATKPPTIEPQQEPTPEDASHQVEQDIPPHQFEFESQLQVEVDDHLL